MNFRIKTSIDNKYNENSFKSTEDKNGLHRTRTKNFKQKYLVVLKINFLTIIEKTITKIDLTVMLSQKISYCQEAYKNANVDISTK